MSTMPEVNPERHAKAMEKVNSLISVRERTAREVRERLGKAGFSDAEVRDAVATSVRVGLVSDERYARALIRGKAHAGWGRRKIVQRLRRDGVSDEIIERCEDCFPAPEEELESAIHVLRRRSSRSSNPYASYMRRLLGKGFSYEVSNRAVRTLLDEERDASECQGGEDGAASGAF